MSPPPPPRSDSPHTDNLHSPNPVETHAPPADLTTWFLNAKRSLSSVALCSRAHVLVDSARAALQEASVISSRCVFLRASLQDQLTIAGQINRMIHTTQDAARVEFEKTLNDLDTADLRLNQTLELLRNTTVDPAFVPPGANIEPSQRGNNTNGIVGNEERDISVIGDATAAVVKVRTLHDFVEDEGIENLKSRLRHSIDYVQESHDALHSSISMFDESLQSLSSSLTSLHDPTPHSEPLHPPLHALEQHTEAMASLLESLTQHYDRCSLALKSTESSIPVDPDLFLVLSRDAAEVDDVVSEIKEHLSNMEIVSTSISSKIEELHLLERETIAVFIAFEEFQRELGVCMDGLREFETRQDELRHDMVMRLDELWQLVDFYNGFVGAYDAMVIEVGRRKGVAARMESIVVEASRKLEALYDEDLQNRELFKNDYGQWLPVDLWPGLSDPPVIWSIEKDLQGGSELPALGKDVIERAMRKRSQKVV
ncbi:APG17-domain-containing protein [Wilcoxina mikolae CBS 423.85]|nr:APG17-domain-containing protein [Wilcoxina mikolae CBS 423.85]